jgi:hypothetical protein
MMKGNMLMIRSLRSGPSALLKTTMMTVLLLGAAAVGAQTPANSAEPASGPVSVTTPKTPPGQDSSQVGYHDLICKPNGTEDGFDCADEATPAKIVPIPSGVEGPRPQDVPVSG